MEYEYLDGFSFNCDGRKHLRRKSLGKMYEIHRRFMYELDYWMTDDFAISGVLRLLPPSYEDHVRGYVMKGESFTCHEFMAKVENFEGRTNCRRSHRRIRYIWYTSYKCFPPTKHLLRFTKYLMLVLLFESCLEGMRWQCVLMVIKMVDGQWHSPSTSIIWINEFE